MATMTGGVKRSYDNEGRRTQSEETRRRILDAARTLLVTKGYRATTVAQIARDAGVHVDTLYAVVGRKLAILRELIELAISGTDRPIAPEDATTCSGCAPNREGDESSRSTPPRCVPSRPAWRRCSSPCATPPPQNLKPKAIWKEISDRRATNMHRLVADLGSFDPGSTSATPPT